MPDSALCYSRRCDPHPPCGNKVVGNFEGVGVTKPKYLKLKWNFLWSGDWIKLKQTYCGDRKDLFWKPTF